MTDYLQAAIDYAELGYRVFPCRPGAKEPACEHGCSDATTDQEQIERWWSANPACNVAIATDGLFVLDIDPDGMQWLATVDLDQLMRGAVTKTPRSGVHYWFRQNGRELRNTTGTIAAGVDTRATGGYVLVPPSVVGGRPYFWVAELETDLPPVPDWLVELLGHRVPLRESVGELIEPGSRNAALFRFASYFRRAGMTQSEIRETVQVVNRTRCQPMLNDEEVGKIAESAARFEPDFVEQSLIMSHFGGTDDDEHEPEPAAATFPGWVIDEMPHVMRDAYDWMIQTSIKPQPQLVLGALIALFGAAFGRKVRDDYDTRTNIMVLALAPSGAGKEWPRQCNKRLLMEAGLDEVNAPERIGSHAGIISSVDKHPIRLFQLDEIGRLLATMRDPKASHLYNVGTVLMQLYSSSNTLWTGDAYADLAKVKRIDQPHVCVYGTSVPESLYGGLSPENLTDGLVGRLLVFQSMEFPQRRKPRRDDDYKAEQAITKLIQWRDFCPAEPGNLEKLKPITASKTPEANERHEAYCDEINRRHGSEDNISSAIWSRAPEKAAKLALIHACCKEECLAGSDPQPDIGLDSVNWGIAIANYSTRLVLAAARNSVSGSRHEANLKWVFSVIDGEITANQLTRKTQRLRSKERAEILMDLRASGAIEMVTLDTGKRPKVVYRRLRDTL